MNAIPRLSIIASFLIPVIGVCKLVRWLDRWVYLRMYRRIYNSISDASENPYHLITIVWGPYPYNHCKMVMIEASLEAL